MNRIRTFTARSGLALLAILAASRCVFAQPAFRLGQVSAAPGQTEVMVPVEIIPEEGIPVSGWSFVVGYDPEVMSSISVEDARQTTAFTVFRDRFFQVPPGFTGAAAYTIIEENEITVANAGTVAL